jgi:taurine transport system permease protein
MAILLIYIVVFVVAFYLVNTATKMMTTQKDYTSLKTVTFGDESAVSPNRPASIISVLAIFMIWGAFTGSKLMPFHAPGPFIGETTFTYTAMNASGETDVAEVVVTVYDIQSGKTPPKMEIDPGTGLRKMILPTL